MERWDEFLLFASAVLVVSAIARRVVTGGGVRKTLERFRSGGIESDEIILLALFIPELLQAFYYFLLLLPIPEFQGNFELRSAVIRPSAITSNIILAIYFLNGRLTGALRRGIHLWNRRSP